MQADEREKQRQGNNDGNNEGGPPVDHEQRNDERNQQNAFDGVVKDGVGGVVDQIFPVVERDKLGILGKDTVVKPFYLGLDPFDDPVRVLALAHQNDAFYGVRVVPKLA